MSRKSAEWLLAGVIFARSTSLLFAKVGLESMSPLNLLAVRFCLAFAVLCVIFWKKLRTTTKTDLLHGMILGAVFFAVMTCETFALTRTHASTVSFLVNTAIVIVPLFEAALHRKAPDHRTLLCAAVTLAGVGFLTLKDGIAGFGMGEALWRKAKPPTQRKNVACALQTVCPLKRYRLQRAYVIRCSLFPPPEAAFPSLRRGVPAGGRCCGPAAQTPRRSRSTHPAPSAAPADRHGDPGAA